MDPNTRPRWTFTLFDRTRDLKVLRAVAVSTVVIAALVIIKDEILWQVSDDPYGSYAGGASAEYACNVLGIELRGDLVTYAAPSDTEEGSADYTTSEYVVLGIEEAERDSATKAILLEIDSYGGWPVAAEEVMLALKHATKPTVALIREGGVSAAYLAATGADTIFASQNSDVGSIGVTMSYLDASRKNQTEGLTFVELSSGTFKDTGNPDKPLSPEERELLMRDIRILRDNFVAAVAENRGLEIAAVDRMADGSTMLGKMALENGLIDRIGGMYEVKEYLKELLGEEPEVCW